ncbi:MAG: manganese efflux pump [Clostridiales bacterium]|nr:manganese efflux pump [Clostridiales bacterium]
MDLGLIVETFMIAAGLSMDAFAVSITDGICYGDSDARMTLAIPITFAAFQGAMVLLGFFLGSAVSGIISDVGHVVAFIILASIGANMIIEAVRERNQVQVYTRKLRAGELLVQGVATSIDALAVGLGLAALGHNLFFSCSMIASVTFIICLCGVLIGKKCGAFLREKAVIMGGIILILIGLKVLLENLL